MAGPTKAGLLDLENELSCSVSTPRASRFDTTPTFPQYDIHLSDAADQGSADLYRDPVPTSYAA